MPRPVSLLCLAVFIVAISACGFRLRGSEIDTGNIGQLKFIHLDNFSLPLQNAFMDFTSGISGLSVSTRESAADRNDTSKAKGIIIRIQGENLNTNKSITDVTIENQEILLFYRLNYSITDTSGKVLRKPNRADLRARINFNEADRISSENKLRETQTKLYMDMARNLFSTALLVAAREQAAKK